MEVRIPVRMFWNASSTLLASKAEVSMNERLLSPGPRQPLVPDPMCRWSIIRTSKLLRLLRRYRPQVSQITLVPHQHNHNIRIRMISQLLQPPLHILIRLMLANIIYQ